MRGSLLLVGFCFNFSSFVFSITFSRNVKMTCDFFVSFVIFFRIFLSILEIFLSYRYFSKIVASENAF